MKITIVSYDFDFKNLPRKRFGKELQHNSCFSRCRPEASSYSPAFNVVQK